MNLEDYLEGLQRLSLAVGDHWFATQDPLAYKLATRLAQLAAEFRERDKHRRRDPHGAPTREAEEPRHRVR